eukprot:7428629-Pyramimonas_sp.AAC.1
MELQGPGVVTARRCPAFVYTSQLDERRHNCILDARSFRLDPYLDFVLGMRRLEPAVSDLVGQRAVGGGLCLHAVL